MKGEKRVGVKEQHNGIWWEAHTCLILENLEEQTAMCCEKWSKHK